MFEFGVFLFVVCLFFGLFFVVSVCNSNYSNKANKNDLEMAGAFASDHSCLTIAVVLNLVELKNEVCGLQKQGAEGTKKAAC